MQVPVQHPRLKPSLAVFYLTIGFVGQGPDYAVEIVDPDGRYAMSLPFLDGQCSMAEIVAAGQATPMAE